MFNSFSFSMAESLSSEKKRKNITKSPRIGRPRCRSSAVTIQETRKKNKKIAKSVDIKRLDDDDVVRGPERVDSFSFSFLGQNRGPKGPESCRVHPPDGVNQPWRQLKKKDKKRNGKRDPKERIPVAAFRFQAWN